jgi:hypothetical protein
VKVLDTSYNAVLKVLAVRMLSSRVGEYDVCVGSDHIANVAFLSTECVFAGEDTPCSAPVCILSEDSDECQQLTADYCLEHPSDTGCTFIVPNFIRSLDTEATLTLHAAGGDAETITFVSPECDCGECFGTPEILVFTTSVLSTKLTAHILPKVSGHFKVCILRLGEAMHVANLEVQGDACVFRHDPNPCSAAVCRDDPESAECQHFLAEYCAEHRDGGCALIVPTFERPLGEVVMVQVITPATVSAVPTVCVASDCGTCEGGGAIQLSAVFDSDMATVEFISRIEEVVKICVDGAHVASVDMIPQGCAFVDGVDTPCQAYACIDPHSEECQQYVAMYCASELGAQDGGCGLAVPVFMRYGAEVTSTTAHYATSDGFAGAAFIPGICQCATAQFDAACSEGDVPVFAQTYDPATMLLTVDFEAVLGAYALCAYDDKGLRHHVLTVIGLVAASETVTTGGVAHPCKQSACEDPNSEECQLFTAEYCLANPLDSACALVVPVFQRIAGPNFPIAVQAAAD